MAQRASAADLRRLLEAVREAIAIPHPATVGDGEVHDRILSERVMHARVALDNVLDRSDDPGWSADYLRTRLLEHPPTGYREYGTPRAPELCAPCKRGDCGECHAVDHPDMPDLYGCHCRQPGKGGCPRPGRQGGEPLELGDDFGIPGVADAV